MMRQAIPSSIPPLVSGGLMLSYHCTNACRHCLYRCSPAQPDEWMTPDTARRIADALAREPDLHSLHLAGGEPTLRQDLLLDLIRLLTSRKLPLAYVETNASWCRDAETTLDGMTRMKDAGLRALLISVSMFHNEFVPFRFTRHAVETSRKVFGRGGTLVYLPHVYDILARMPDDGTHTLNEFCRFVGIEPDSPRLTDLYDVIPGGRAPQALRKCYPSRPARMFSREACASNLFSTSHFHIDHHANIFTGCCAGIVPATADNFHPPISAKTHPAFSRLCEKGPFGLMELAVEEHDFKPRPDGYVSKCDLCFDVRRTLQASGQFPELRPAAYYTT